MESIDYLVEKYASINIATKPIFDISSANVIRSCKCLNFKTDYVKKVLKMIFEELTEFLVL